MLLVSTMRGVSTGVVEVNHLDVPCRPENLLLFLEAPHSPLHPHGHHDLDPLLVLLPSNPYDRLHDLPLLLDHHDRDSDCVDDDLDRPFDQRHVLHRRLSRTNCGGKL